MTYERLLEEKGLLLRNHNDSNPTSTGTDADTNGEDDEDAAAASKLRSPVRADEEVIINYY